MSNDAKKAILARRAKFLAAAIAGLGVACGKEQAAACLSIVAPPSDAGAPQPCLSAWSPPENPPEQDASDAGPPPRPCLQPVPHTAEPRPCLSIAPPPPDAGSRKK